MQHAEEKKGKRFLKQIFSDVPTQTKKKEVHQKKRSTYKLKRGLNYTENREPELHLTNTYIQKKERKKNLKFSPLS